MKPFIVAIVTLILFTAACMPAASPSGVMIDPAGQAQLPPAPRVEGRSAQEGTLTSEYVPGAIPSASFEAFVSAKELSGNGVEFTSVTLSELHSSTGTFAYLSRKHDQGTTIYTMDVFTNYYVAEYEATRVEALNLFRIQGEKAQAKKNMAEWCQAQGPQTLPEAGAERNKVICFGFLETD